MNSTVHEQLQLSLYQVARTPYQTLTLRNGTHGHWALSYVVEGNVETITRGERFAAPAGTAMIHPPHLPYSEIASGAGIHEWIVFDASLSPNSDLFRLYPISPVVRIVSPAEFSQIFQMLLRTWHEPASPFRGLHLVTLTTQLLGLVLESWRAAGSNPRPATLMTPQDRFTEVIYFMGEHLAQKLTRDLLAGRVCLHPTYFDRAFREIYGVAPMQMLRAMRLHRARQLLESTEMTIAAVAAASGFEEVSYFHRVFQRHYQLTPTRYRESVKSAINSYIPALSHSDAIC